MGTDTLRGGYGSKWDHYSTLQLKMQYKTRYSTVNLRNYIIDRWDLLKYSCGITRWGTLLMRIIPKINYLINTIGM